MGLFKFPSEGWLTEHLVTNVKFPKEDCTHFCPFDTYLAVIHASTYVLVTLSLVITKQDINKVGS